MEAEVYSLKMRNGGHRKADAQEALLCFNKVFGFCGVFFLSFSRAAPTAFGGFQDGSLIRAVATGLHRSHSNTRSEQCLQTTPQLTARSLTHRRSQGWNPHPMDPSQVCYG